MRNLIVLGLLGLAACGTPGKVVEERVSVVNVPVMVGCADRRPDPVRPLNSIFTQEQWDAMDPKQKAAHVAAQGLRRQNYGDSLNAATANCPPA